MNTRAEILSLLNGEPPASPPAFSGLIHVTAEGMASEGLSFLEVHHDAKKMAKAAASTFKWTGIPSATLPLDLCMPAEMLGAELTYERGGFPQVRRAVLEKAGELGESENWGLETGRLEIVCEAIRLVKEAVGKDVVISGMIPGPYTLLLYLCNPKNLFIEMKREPQAVMDALLHLASLLSRIGLAYRDSGADYITVHDMGGSPGFIGPTHYEQFVFPAEKVLIEKLPAPRVLSVCGNVSKSLSLLNQGGAEAISVDQLNDLAASRKLLDGVLLFGNLDPVETVCQGSEVQIRESVRMAVDAGVDAIWPGCDLVPETPIQNLRTLISS